MSASNLTRWARDEGLHGQKNLLSLLIIYSTTALMTAAVYFVAYLVVSNPLSAASSDISKLQIGKQIMQTFKQKTLANNALSTVPVYTSKADAHNVQYCDQFHRTRIRVLRVSAIILPIVASMPESIK